MVHVSELVVPSKRPLSDVTGSNEEQPISKHQKVDHDTNINKDERSTNNNNHDGYHPHLHHHKHHNHHEHQHSEYPTNWQQSIDQSIAMNNVQQDIIHLKNDLTLERIHQIEQEAECLKAQLHKHK